MKINNTYPGQGLTFYDLVDGDELAVRVGWDEELQTHQWIRVVVSKVTPTQAAVVIRHPLLRRTMEMRYLRRVTVGSRIPFWPAAMNWSGCATYLMTEKLERTIDEYDLRRLCHKLGKVHPDEVDYLTYVI